MDAETKAIIDLFESLSRIPRQSKHEEKISKWLLGFAEKAGVPARADKKGNVVITIPASPGRENAPIVVLQGHMDMVCEKIPESNHDFSKDPITLVYDGEWIEAKETSLGADNGIAVAYCLALAISREVAHPPLELLFTVDEERGLNGAKALTPDFLKGRIFLNLDSEDEGVFTIGCAGGRDGVLSLEPARVETGKDSVGLKLSMSGLAGGHSGVDIDKHRANALKLMARLLLQLVKDHGVGVVSLSGGTAVNAIPRNADAVIAVKPDTAGKVSEAVNSMAAVFRSESASADGNLSIDISKASLEGKKAFTEEFALRFIRLLRLIPSGPREYSADIQGLVETSSNLANVNEKEGKIEILTSQRSSVESRLSEVSADIECAGLSAGAVVRMENFYPGWQPDTASPLLKKSTEVYRRLFSKEPVVEVIHAGLECGVIGSIYDGMDMISFGPTIKNAHSPDERAHIPSIGTTWKFLTALLESIT